MQRIFPFIFSFSLIIVFSPFISGQITQEELKGIYDSSSSAVKEGNFEKILLYSSENSRNDIISNSKTKEEKEDLLKIGKMQIPESYEILHMQIGRDSLTAILQTIMQFDANKEYGRERARLECEIHFKKENGKWKLDSILYLTDPDQIKRPDDLTYNPGDADMEKESEIGGRIISIDFKKDYSVVILRVIDEEDAVFLPSKDKLEVLGISLDDLIPWNIFEFNGHPHKTDKLKFFAVNGNLVNN